jgi:hypothetical protein
MPSMAINARNFKCRGEDEEGDELGIVFSVVYKIFVVWNLTNVVF